MGPGKSNSDNPYASPKAASAGRRSPLLKTVHHDLAVFEASPEDLRIGILTWLEGNRFRVRVEASENRITAVFPGWYGFGITDRQTRRRLDILLERAGSHTAVSVVHQTSAFLFFVGTMFGDILSREARDLLAYLRGAPRERR